MRSPLNPKVRRRETDVDLKTKTSLPIVALVVISSSMFVSMTGEFLPGGLLPEIGRELDVTIAAGGQLVTVFAFAVIVLTTPFSVWTRNLPRKPLLLASFAAICIAGIGSALAPSFAWLIFGRFIAGAAHGAFWSVAAAYTAYLVPAAQLGRATAITAGGGSLAGIVGVPLGNALGQLFGWRAAFVAVGVAGLFCLILLWRMLPAVEHRSRVSEAGTLVSVSDDNLRNSRRNSLPAVLALCVVVLLFIIAQSGFSTYIVPWLQGAANLPANLIPIYLLCTGIAGAFGVVTSAAFADRFPRGTVIASASLILLAQGSVSFVDGGVGVLLLAFTWSFSFGAIPPLLQARMMRIAAVHQRSLAAALQTTAINVGIGGGALAGGIAVTGLGLTILPWFAVAVTALGLLGFVILGRERAPEPSMCTANTGADSQGL